MSGQHESGESTALAIREPGLLAKFAEMVTLIPAEGADGAAERILAQILSAEQWDELDAPWEASKAEQLLGKRLRLNYAERRPSDFREGLGMFLVLHCTDTANGEEVVATTSSVNVIGQVVRAYSLNAMPLIIEFIVADRPTTKGYRPHHLKILGSGASQGARDASAAAEA